MNFSLNTSIVENWKSKKPSYALILCHGFGGNKKSFVLLAKHWQRFLPNTIIYCPEAPYACHNLNNSFQWFNPNENNKKILNCLIESEIKLNKFIDQIVEKNKIDNNKIFLVGFSQGSILSLFTGIKRKKKVKLIISYSGRIIGKKYLEKNICSKPKIFLFHGDKDKVIDIKFFEKTRDFLRENDFKLYSKIFINCEHKIPTEGIKLGLEILKKNM